MDSSTQAPLTLQTLANAMNELQGQLRNAHAQIAAQQNALNETQQKLTQATQQLAAREVQAPLPAIVPPPAATPKVNPPMTFKGKGSILSWTTHMTNYLQNVGDEKALTIAISYLADGAHEC